MLALPRGDSAVDVAVLGNDASALARSIDRLVSLTSADRFKKELTRIRSQLKDLDGASPRSMEEAVRALGELLGFAANRPDNDVGTGPDVLWTDGASRRCLAFELKTDKSNPATYWKKDISDGHDHLAWLVTNKADCECLGLLFVGPDGAVHSKANASDTMWHCAPSSLADLRDRLLIGDLRNALPLERPGKTRGACDDGSWEIAVLFERLKNKRMGDMVSRSA
jgi:hypothetical protein